MVLRHMGWTGSQTVRNPARGALTSTSLFLMASCSFGEFLKSGVVRYVHMAPPCGTSSRARNRPVSQYLKDQGAFEPKPLRSAACPMGLPGLDKVDMERVSKANILYDLCADVATWAAANGVFFSIENPASSFFWEYPAIFAILDDNSIRSSVFILRLPSCSPLLSREHIMLSISSMNIVDGS